MSETGKRASSEPLSNRMAREDRLMSRLRLCRRPHRNNDEQILQPTDCGRDALIWDLRDGWGGRSLIIRHLDQVGPRWRMNRGGGMAAWTSQREWQQARSRADQWRQTQRPRKCWTRLQEMTTSANKSDRTRYSRRTLIDGAPSARGRQAWLLRVAPQVSVDW